MSDERVDAQPLTDSGPGYYAVPDHHGRVVERRWDGDVWTDEVRPAPEGVTLAHYKRHLFGFLENPGWKLLIVFLVSLAVAAVLWGQDTENKIVSGVQIPLPLFAFIATLTTMVALLIFIGRRVRFDRIVAGDRKRILKWGVFSGVVGVGVALGVEFVVPKIFGESIKDDHGWALIAGPAEETGKILVPVILWIKGYFRKPIEGYLLVLISACTFGIIEGTEYGFQPVEYQTTRPPFEIMHPLFTGFIAAVGWQVAWRRRQILTWALAGAWLVAVLVHSVNDIFAIDEELADISRATAYVTIVAVLVMYLLQKHSARQLVPPENVEKVSPRWRPLAPRASRSD